jgi:uncharacterized protein (TIGR01244 family)
MVEYRTVDDDYVVAPQIKVEEVKAIADAGFKALVCTRPDHEDPGQADFAAIAAEAARHGLPAVQIPMSGQAKPEDIAAFRKAMDELARPIFSYCRSGNRANILYGIYKRG